MSINRKIKVDNFTFDEVVHRPQDLPEDLVPVGYIVLGFMQALREAAEMHFKKQVGVTITSGYRKPSVNANTPGSANNSYHQWRIDSKGQAVWAVDTKPTGVSLFEWFNFARQAVIGEVYLNRKEGIVHISSYGKDEEFTV